MPSDFRKHKTLLKTFRELQVSETNPGLQLIINWWRVRLASFNQLARVLQRPSVNTPFVCTYVFLCPRVFFVVWKQALLERSLCPSGCGVCLEGNGSSPRSAGRRCVWMSLLHFCCSLSSLWAVRHTQAHKRHENTTMDRQNDPKRFFKSSRTRTGQEQRQLIWILL